MKRSGILVLTLLTLILGAYLYHGSETQENIALKGAKDKVFPMFSQQLDRIKHIKVKSGAQEPFEMVLKNDIWEMVQREGYPVSQSKVNTLFLSLMEAEFLEPKTSKEDYYSRLGVQEPGPSGGLKLTLIDDKEGIIASLLVGDKAYGGQGGTYIRLAEERQSWLVSGELSLGSMPPEWLETSITHIPASEIKQMTITQSNQKPLTIVKTERAQDAFKIESLPQGAQLASPNAHNHLASSLSHLTLSDVEHYTKDKWQRYQKAMIAVELFNGQNIAAVLYERDDKHYLMLQKQDPLQASAQSDEFWLDFDKSNWIFEIPPYKAASWMKSVDDYLLKETQQ